MKISELGEFGLVDIIRTINEKFSNAEQLSWQHLLVGIGDDAAAWQGNNHIQLATTDSLVQDVHFDLGTITWEELGWKALAVNLSDIAAMGGAPRYALVSLSCPGDIEVEGISRFCHSMASLGAEFGVAIVGGNLAAGPSLVITVTVLGCSRDKLLLKRSTATPGEQIAVTGYLGLSSAGLEMLRKGIRLDIETSAILRKAHLQPIPRVREGQILIQRGVNSAIDISDGLIADLDHICEASTINARVEIDRVPIHQVVRTYFPNYLELALFGGEDYELLFTADSNTVDRAREALDCPVTVVGHVVEQGRLPNRVTLVDGKGDVVPHARGGWEHFT